MGNKNPPTDDQLGDHTLVYKIGKNDNCVASVTYSYSNMKGEGDVSQTKFTGHRDRIY